VAAAILWLRTFVFSSDPWPAQVTAQSATQVCTTNLTDVPDWRQHVGDRNCFDRSDQSTDWKHIHLQVGDCVRLRVHHPVLVIESRIQCPAR